MRAMHDYRVRATRGAVSVAVCEAAAVAAGIRLNDSLKIFEAVGDANPHAECAIDGETWVCWPGFGWRKAVRGVDF